MFFIFFFLLDNMSTNKKKIILLSLHSIHSGVQYFWRERRRGIIYNSPINTVTNSKLQKNPKILPPLSSFLYNCNFSWKTIFYMSLEIPLKEMIYILRSDFLRKSDEYINNDLFKMNSKKRSFKIFHFVILSCNNLNNKNNCNKKYN